MGGRRPKYRGFLNPDEAKRELEKLRPLREAVIKMQIGRFHAGTPGYAELYAIIVAIDRAAENFCGDADFFLPPLTPGRARN